VVFGWFDDEVPHVEGEFPETLYLSVSRFEEMETAGTVERDDDLAHLQLANGHATYRIIDVEHDEMTLELIEGEVG
jgi:hypothetical protein